MKKRLSKTLAAAGVASRRACESLIFDGLVQVNGQTVRIPQTLVDLEHDTVRVNGEQVGKEEAKVYFLFHKPAGYLCTSDPVPRSVLNFFSHLPHRLFTVGRLDKETSGLLLVTNDGTFAHHVIHPSFGVKKHYIAKTGQEITPEHLKKLSLGIEIEGSRVIPFAVKKVRRGTVKIVVKDGKKHEVRLLLEAAGLTVRELVRFQVGSLSLDNLAAGSYRVLSKEEISSFEK